MQASWMVFGYLLFSPMAVASACSPQLQHPWRFWFTGAWRRCVHGGTTPAGHQRWRTPADDARGVAAQLGVRHGRLVHARPICPWPRLATLNYTSSVGGAYIVGGALLYGNAPRQGSRCCSRC